MTFGDIYGALRVEDFAFLEKQPLCRRHISGVDGVSGRRSGKNGMGTNWAGVGGFVGSVFGMTTDGTNLYAAGTFTNAGVFMRQTSPKWNGTNWSALGGRCRLLQSSSFILTQMSRSGRRSLYVGGIFTNVRQPCHIKPRALGRQRLSKVGGSVNGQVADVDVSGK